jgi:hypothetical protein
MKGSKKEAPKRQQEEFDESYPTPAQLRIKGLADAISSLMQIPSPQNSADNALELARKLYASVKAMSKTAWNPLRRHRRNSRRSPKGEDSGQH